MPIPAITSPAQAQHPMAQGAITPTTVQAGMRAAELANQAAQWVGEFGMKAIEFASSRVDSLVGTATSAASQQNQRTMQQSAQGGNALSTIGNAIGGIAGAFGGGGGGIGAAVGGAASAAGNLGPVAARASSVRPTVSPIQGGYSPPFNGGSASSPAAAPQRISQGTTIEPVADNRAQIQQQQQQAAQIQQQQEAQAQQAQIAEQQAQQRVQAEQAQAAQEQQKIAEQQAAQVRAQQEQQAAAEAQMAQQEQQMAQANQAQLAQQQQQQAQAMQQQQVAEQQAQAQQEQEAQIAQQSQVAQQQAVQAPQPEPSQPSLPQPPLQEAPLQTTGATQYDAMMNKQGIAAMPESQTIGEVASAQGGGQPQNPLDRTDWRGYVDVDINKFRSQLPKQAQGLAEDFIGAAKQYNLNPVALLAIAKHETANFSSSAFRNKNNAMGSSNAKGPLTFSNPSESIYRQAKTIANPQGPYGKARSLRDFWMTYSPPKGASNDPYKLNQYWGPQVSSSWSKLESQIGRGAPIDGRATTPPDQMIAMSSNRGGQAAQSIGTDKLPPQSRGELSQSPLAQPTRSSRETLPAQKAQALASPDLSSLENRRMPSINRTDWRQYQPVGDEEISNLLPENVKNLAPVFNQYAEEFDVNPVFLMSVARAETNNFKDIRGNNAMGIRDAGGNLVQVPSMEEGIRLVAKAISNPRGYYGQARSLEDVGSRYSKNAGQWGGNVLKSWNDYETQILKSRAMRKQQTSAPVPEQQAQAQTQRPAQRIPKDMEWDPNTQAPVTRSAPPAAPADVRQFVPSAPAGEGRPVERAIPVAPPQAQPVPVQRAMPVGQQGGEAPPPPANPFSQATDEDFYGIINDERRFNNLKGGTEFQREQFVADYARRGMEEMAAQIQAGELDEAGQKQRLAMIFEEAGQLGNDIGIKDAKRGLAKTMEAFTLAEETNARLDHGVTYEKAKDYLSQRGMNYIDLPEKEASTLGALIAFPTLSEGSAKTKEKLSSIGLPREMINSVDTLNKAVTLISSDARLADDIRKNGGLNRANISISLPQGDQQSVKMGFVNEEGSIVDERDINPRAAEAIVAARQAMNFMRQSEGAIIMGLPTSSKLASPNSRMPQQGGESSPSQKQAPQGSAAEQFIPGQPSNTPGVPGVPGAEPAPTQATERSWESVRDVARRQGLPITDAQAQMISEQSQNDPALRERLMKKAQIENAERTLGNNPEALQRLQRMKQSLGF